MSDDKRIEQLELENKVLQDNNRGLKAKIDELQKEKEQLKSENNSYADILNAEIKDYDTLKEKYDKLQKENKKLKKQSEISAKTHIKNDDLNSKVIDLLYEDLELEYSGTRLLKSLEDYYEEAENDTK